MKTFELGVPEPGDSRSFVHFEGDDLILEDRQTAQDNKEILEDVHNHRMYGRKESPGGFRLAATVPVTINERWRKEWQTTGAWQKWKWTTYVAMKLNSPEWKYLRALDAVPVFNHQR